MAFYSGTTGYVLLGATPYNFDDWKLSIKAGAPTTNNFITAPFQTVVPGMIKGDITISGPWNIGNCPVTVNNQYVFHLGSNTGVELIVTAQVNSIEPGNKVDDTPRVTIGATSNGLFTAAIT